GGRGGTPVMQAIYQEEMTTAGAPGILGRLGVTLLAPTLVALGSDWQKETYIEKILSGELIFCQGFSAPDAGSDLPGLRTRAARRDGKWTLSGQKTWSSGAHYSHRSFLLARTDPAVRTTRTRAFCSRAPTPRPSRIEASAFSLSTWSSRASRCGGSSR